MATLSKRALPLLVAVLVVVVGVALLLTSSSFCSCNPVVIADEAEQRTAARGVSLPPNTTTAPRKDIERPDESPVKDAAAKHRRQDDQLQDGCRREFFSVMASVWLSDSAANSTNNYHVALVRNLPQLTYLSAQMEAYNSTLTIYVTPQSEVDRGLINDFFRRHHYDLTGDGKRVRFQEFDAEELLRSNGFTDDHMHQMKKWDVHSRLSDIFRLCLQNRFRQVYIDLDILFLAASPEVFYQPFVSVGVWADRKGALEPTNAIFCVSPDFLHALMRHQQEVILSKGGSKAWQYGSYFYTELGPAAFQVVLLNRHGQGDPLDVPPIRILSENNPIDLSLIEHGNKRYRHTHMHITGAIRFSEAMRRAGGFVPFVLSLRRKLGAPDLPNLSPVK